MPTDDATHPGTLPNLGPASTAWLERAGIGTVAQLRALGAVRAFRRVRAVQPSANLNLLWAIEGALSGRPWQRVARDDRTRLLLELDDLDRGLAGRDTA